MPGQRVKEALVTEIKNPGSTSSESGGCTFKTPCIRFVLGLGKAYKSLHLMLDIICVRMRKLPGNFQLNLYLITSLLCATCLCCNKSESTYFPFWKKQLFVIFSEPPKYSREQLLGRTQSAHKIVRSSKLKLQLPVVCRLRRTGVKVVAGSLAHKLHEIEDLRKQTKAAQILMGPLQCILRVLRPAWSFLPF